MRMCMSPTPNSGGADYFLYWELFQISVVSSATICIEWNLIKPLSANNDRKKNLNNMIYIMAKVLRAHIISITIRNFRSVREKYT